jgi:acetaldehyde dehydrogenase / alcohol dehydrogenase
MQQGLFTLGLPHRRKVGEMKEGDGSMSTKTERSPLAEVPEEDVEAMVGRAVAAQQEIQTWSEQAIDRLLQALAQRVHRQAEELARAAVQETGLGNVTDKTAKNRFASLDVYRSLAGRVGQGCLAIDRREKIMTLASPVGVVFGLVPATNPTSTFIFKVLICLKGRNAVILSPSQRAVGVSHHLGGLLQQVLCEQGAPADLVQWVGAKSSRATAGAFMEHPGVAFILATGGPALVKAAYRSGKPAIGVGAGNAPVLVCADADLQVAASSIVNSKAFDNGIVCCSEQNLVVVQSRLEAFKQMLQQCEAAVLSEEETRGLLRIAIEPTTNRLTSWVSGQQAADIAVQAQIRRPYPIRLLVVPTQGVSEHNPLAREKLAPILSLFTVPNEQVGMRMCEDLLALEGAGHTAMIYTCTARLAEEFAARIPASRILVNAPGTQGGLGMTTGLVPSLTLGSGTLGGTSTTDNITYTHLLNVKRVAYSLPSR